MEEIFRFMCLRPPEAVDLDLSNHIDTTNLQSVFQGQLKEVHSSENALQDMVNLAEEFIASEKFVDNLDQLSIPLKQFGEHLLQEESPNLTIICQMVLHVFNQDATILIIDPNYINDRQNTADSLIALIIAKEEQTQNYNDLIYAFCLFGILERVAAQDATLDMEEAIDEAFNQTVLLPVGIFPLPSCQYPEEISPEEQEAIRREEIKKHQEAEMLKQRLVNLQTALDELSSVSASDFKQVVDQGEIQEQSPWILSEEAIKRLSQSTRVEINNLSISLDKTPFTEATQILETEFMNVGTEVYKAEEPTKMVKIGSTFFDVTDISPEMAAGVSLGAGREGAFRQVGIADLMVVKQEIQKYEADEIAHIENVLKGESKDRTHRRLKRSEEIYLTETETTEESEEDLHTTDRFELQTAAQETIKQDSSLGVDVTVKYGGVVDVTANTKYATKKSSEKSTQTATKYARDMTNRSVSSIQEKVRKQQVKKTIQEVEVTNVHKIDNKESPDHVVGIYRYVNKFYNAQVYNYGERLMFEFIVPEPSAFLQLACKKTEDFNLSKPDPFTIKANDINKANYLWWAKKYDAYNVESPPHELVTVSKAFDARSENQEKSNLTKSEELSIPSGYKALKGVALMDFNYWDQKAAIDLVVGQQWRRKRRNDRVSWWFSLNDEIGTLPITIKTWDTRVYTVAIEIICKLTERAREEWRIKTHAAIMQAYLNLKSEYEEQSAAASVGEGIGISGSNPKLNRQLEKAELKKGALTLLTKKTSPHFNFVGSVTTTEKDLINPQKNQEYYKGYPEINFDEADREASYIQFFEQAFEWDQITYTFYPYYWARKKLWTTLQQIQDTDPIYAQFLQAGAARILAPVRPGYEKSILYYLETNKIWNGGSQPSVSSKLYVSIVQTIKEKYGIYHTTREGTISVEKNSKIVKGKGTKFTKDDIDREIYIKSIQYRIAKVDSSKQVALTEKYREENELDIAYAIGIKFVGVPWRIKIPTSLVYLEQDEVQLPDLTKD